MPAQPVVIVATLVAKPGSADAVRAAATTAVSAAHGEPGCQLYALHETDGTFVFVEQYADKDAMDAHAASATVADLFAAIGDHLAAPPDLKVLSPVPAGDSAKGLLRG